MTKIFIDGSQGTTGLKIFNRINSRNDVELLTISENDRKNLSKRLELIGESDVTFLCLPDDASREIAKKASDSTIIIDASTAHRTESGWAYGFPELSADFRKKIENSNRIAVPGCYASGFNSIVYPLVSSGVMANDYPITCFAMSGYSGAGKSGYSQYQDENRPLEFDSPRQYALTQNHKHLKEMKYINNLTQNPIFAPHICSYPCGMVVSVSIFTNILNKKANKNDLYELFKNHYDDSKIVKVRPIGYTENMLGSNNFENRDDMEIEIHGNDDRIIVTSRFDNLGKGASGAAVECLNIKLGVDETTTLNIGE